MGAHRSKQHDPKPDVVEKWKRAVQLRLGGALYSQIAVELGYKDHTGARYAVLSAMEWSVQEPADELRNIEGARLDFLLMAVWPKKEDLVQERDPPPPGARVGPINVDREQRRVDRLHSKVDRILRLMERRARLLGLDAPVVHKLTTVADIKTDPVSDRLLTDDRFRDEYLGLIKRAQAGPSHPGGPGDAGNGGQLADGAPPRGADE